MFNYISWYIINVLIYPLRYILPFFVICCDWDLRLWWNENNISSWEKLQNNTVAKNKEIFLTTSSSRSYYYPLGRQKLKLISTNLSLSNNYKCQPDKIWDDINGERYVKRTFFRPGWPVVQWLELHLLTVATGGKEKNTKNETNYRRIWTNII